MRLVRIGKKNGAARLNHLNWFSIGTCGGWSLLPYFNWPLETIPRIPVLDLWADKEVPLGLWAVGQFFLQLFIVHVFS